MDKPKVLLDSGAFTAWKQNVRISLNQYAKFVKENEHEFDGCFNLDVIGDLEKSYNNWLLLKAKGVNTIPIFHLSGSKDQKTEEDYLRKYLDQTDFIGVGAVATLDDSQRRHGLDRIFEKYFVDSQGRAKVKVHGLGTTSTSMMKRYPWYSVDSFTPVISAVWGSVLLPRWNENGIPQYDDLLTCRISNQANYEGDSESTWLGLPESVRALNCKLFESLNFELGEVTNIEKKDRRGKKGEQKGRQQPMFVARHPADPNEMSLANKWEIRMHWNLLIWRKLQDILKDVIINTGVSTTTHLKIFGKVTPKLHMLISYYYCSDSIFKAIKHYRND